jgi:hypothetical protein
MKTLLRSIGTG